MTPRVSTLWVKCHSSKIDRRLKNRLDLKAYFNLILTMKQLTGNHDDKYLGY